MARRGNFINRTRIEEKDETEIRLIPSAAGLEWTSTPLEGRRVGAGSGAKALFRL